MDRFRRKSSTESSSTTLFERTINGLSIQRSKSPSFIQRSKSPSFSEPDQPPEDARGPLGLNLLHSPPEPLIDFTFVHGLGGGSRKTWAKTSDPYHYWPKEWLGKDPEFKNVRVHSFGYNSDWGERKGGYLAINDFSRSLLNEIENDPGIKRDRTRIVLIGHSMGGLVIKKAYIIARQDPTFKDLAPCFHSIFFLATPNRGSSLASTLNNILRVTYGQKSYVNELEPNSALLASINDEFRHYALDLQLWSFYEALESDTLISNTIVVDKGSATLGYPHERIALLNADHRGMCKFERPSDPNYRTIRNAFNTTISAITLETTLSTQEVSREEVQRLKKFISISDIPEDDMLAVEEARMTGTCEWFTGKVEFIDWRSPRVISPPILWLSGNPTSGKSIIAGHVIGVASRPGLLWLTVCDPYYTRWPFPESRSELICFNWNPKGFVFEKNDERAIWRKFFLGVVFQARFTQSFYWVIDALDECKNPQSLISLFMSINDQSLQIFFTSRKIQEIERGLEQLKQRVTHVEMQVSDTLRDIELFVSSKFDRLPVEGDESRANLTMRIIEKSNGSFLWVHLVMQELEYTWSEEGVDEVLDEIPADMNQLYMRTLENMAKVGRTTKLAKSILTWTVCSSRLLTISELQCALKLDINESVPSLGSSISSTCGQLAFVDHRSRVQMIHQTARDFLFQENLESPFAVNRKEGHARLAVKCLEFLSGEQLKLSRSRMQKQKVNAKPSPIWEFALTNYACTYFSDHLYKCSSLQSEPWDALYTFLDNNVLQWIEQLARNQNLDGITLTAMNLKAYLERRAKYFPPLGQRFRVIQAWAIDLIRVSAKFRAHLLTSPSSIHRLIPPFCPADSIIAQTYTSPNRGLIFKGLRATKWDDCLTQINFHGAQATAVDHGDQYFAVGLSTGQFNVYRGMYGQIHHILQHPERIKVLKFGNDDKLLASSGLRNICIWDPNSGDQISTIAISRQLLSLAFSADNEDLIAAIQGNYVARWSLDGTEKPRVEWNYGFNVGASRTRRRQPPNYASFSPDRSLLAVACRGHPILLFDLESQTVFGSCARSSILGTGKEENHYPVDALAFNSGHSTSILIASYADGELTVYNTRTTEPKCRIPKVYAQTLACSPDGRTIITGSAFGVIQVFEVDGAYGDSLSSIYRINAGEEGIWSLTFSSDNLCFIDISGSNCRIWEPEALIRRELHDGDQSELSDPVTVSQVSIDTVVEDSRTEIASMICHPNGEIVFCGRFDGIVAAYSTRNGQASSTLYDHGTCAVTFITLRETESILATADDSGTVILCRINDDAESLACEVLTRQRFGHAVHVLLLSSMDDRLLVGAEDRFELWTYQGLQVSSRSFETQKYRKVITFPLQLKKFVIFEPSKARIFSWADFEEQTGPAGIKLDRLGNHPAEFGSSVSYYGTSFLAELRTTIGYKSSSQFECWETCNIDASAKAVASLPGFDLLGSTIKHIISVVDTTLFFVNRDLWICSLDLQKFGTMPQFKRHFFIPTDWSRTYGNMLFQITSKNEFVFVKKNELVVMKGGLDYAETISLSRELRVFLNDTQTVALIGLAG